MKRIPLDKGFFALVDDEDFKALSCFKWRIMPCPNTNYVCRSIKRDRKVKKILMHRVILGSVKGQLVDHKNGNGLDNRKENIRHCTHGQNCANVVKKLSQSSSKYKGVVYVAGKVSPWRARITFKGKVIYLGSYREEKDAGVAYNRAALHYFKDFAKINVF